MFGGGEEMHEIWKIKIYPQEEIPGKFWKILILSKKKMNKIYRTQSINNDKRVCCHVKKNRVSDYNSSNFLLVYSRITLF